MRRAGALLIAAVLLLTLCACKRETRPAAGIGRFTGEQVSVYGGDWQPIGEVYSGLTYLELNADGEGVFCVDGEAAAVEWAAADGRLTLTMGGARCEGTISADTIDIDFFDADIRMKFFRPASAALPLPEQAQEAEADTEPLFFRRQALFANQVARFTSDSDAGEVIFHLKDIEREAGRTPEEKKQEIVRLDIDLLSCDSRVYKPEDLKRDYIIRGLKELNDGKSEATNAIETFLYNNVVI